MAADDWEPEEPEQARTWWDTAKDVGRTVDDTVRAAANAVTFGMADRLAGYAGGEGTDAEVKKSEAARERSPYASIAGDVAGSLAIPGFGAEALAARYGSGIGARALGYGVTGAATGAGQGAGNTYTGNFEDYVKNAGIGAALGGAFGAAGGAAFGNRPQVSRAASPPARELHGEATGNYRDLAQSRAPYEPSVFRRHADDLEADLLAERFHWRDSPATWRGLDEMRAGGVPGQINTGLNAIIDPASIEFIRKGLNKIPQGEARATDRESARIVKQGLDDFIINPPPGAVLPGGEREAARASRLATDARDNWSAYKRRQAVDDLIHNAQNTTGATHSGLNLENELRKGVRTFTKLKGGTSPASRAGFNADEVADLTRFTRGTSPTNLLRWASASLGGGGGIGGPIAALAYGTGGGAIGHYFKDDPVVGGTIGAAAPILGGVLRRTGNRMADRNIATLGEDISRRSPLYQERLRLAPTVPGPGSHSGMAKASRDAIALELMKQEPLQITVNPRKRDNTDSDWE